MASSLISSNPLPNFIVHATPPPPKEEGRIHAPQRGKAVSEAADRVLGSIRSRGLPRRWLPRATSGGSRE
ncbi:uncharacterized protein G2W53_003463 [Senna tora]|uniref:Uncharacterized protein n=1 Tax=Senna tora TaxID=362788 RepID=A0A834XA84_9FABA|nr:uncharacterized protein G2W53_003463 [Senna tora]